MHFTSFKRFCIIFKSWKKKKKKKISAKELPYFTLYSCYCYSLHYFVRCHVGGGWYSRDPGLQPRPGPVSVLRQPDLPEAHHFITIVRRVICTIFPLSQGVNKVAYSHSIGEENEGISWLWGRI